MTDWVVVATVQGQFEEDQLRAFLEAHGVATEVRGETLRMTHGLSLAGLGAVDLLVPGAQAEVARELLAQAERGDLRVPDADPPRGPDRPR